MEQWLTVYGVLHDDKFLINANVEPGSPGFRKELTFNLQSDSLVGSNVTSGKKPVLSFILDPETSDMRLGVFVNPTFPLTGSQQVIEITYNNVQRIPYAWLEAIMASKFKKGEGEQNENVLLFHMWEGACSISDVILWYHRRIQV